MNLKDLIKNAYLNGKTVQEISERYSISQKEVAKYISEILSEIPKNYFQQTVTIKKYVRILCIKERPSCIDGIHKGEVVYADITSLYIDSDGDTFMEVYDSFGRYIGMCNMKRFKSIK